VYIARLFRIRKDQDNFIRALPGEDVAHVRIALDDYIEMKKGLNVSASESKRGDINE
jgi:hypothetical protein